MVLHGYKRPGHGFISGRCLGMRFPAYEISTEGCVYVRDGLRNTAANKRKLAARVLAGEVQEIERDYTDYKGWGKSEKKSVKLTPASSEAEFRLIGYWRWEEVVKSEASRLERDAKDLEREALEFQKAIDDWKPGMEFISEERLNAQKQEARQAAKDAKARARWAKAFGQALAAGPVEHKRRWEDLQRFRSEQVQKHWMSTPDGFARYTVEVTRREEAVANVGAFPSDKERAAARRGK